MPAEPERAALVGRSAELAVLQCRLIAARQGSGGLVLVTGEAGIGKTRLLQEVAGAARAHEMTVLSGRGVEGGGAFRPLVEALVRAAPVELAEKPELAAFRPELARLLPGWAHLAGAPASPLIDPMVVLGEAVLALLRMVVGDRGALLTIDDLHWADRDSLALLRYLAGRLSAIGVLVLGASRDGEPGTVELSALAGDPLVTALALGRLAPADVAELAGVRAGVELPEAAVRAVVRCSDGVPLLVEELLPTIRGLGPAELETFAPAAISVPAVFVRLTQRRLDRLTEPALDLVRNAALLGDEIDWTVLVEIGGQHEAAVAADLREAAATHLIVLDPARGGAPRWRHPLTRAAVLATILPPELTALARQAIDALDAGPLARDQLALAADLNALAGRPSEAARRLLELARQLVDGGALAAAEQTLGRAEQFVDQAPALRAELVVEQVRVLALAGQPDEAIRAAGDHLTASSGPRHLELALHLARAAVAAERFSDAERYLQLAETEDDPRLGALRAHVALGRGDVDEAVRLAEAAAVSAEQRGMPEAACDALEIVGRYLRRRDVAASDAAFARSLELATRHGLGPWRIRSLTELGYYDLFLRGRIGRLDEARRLAKDAGMLALVAGIDLQVGSWVWTCQGFVASMGLLQGCVDRARRLRLDGPRAKAMIYIVAGRVLADELGDLDAALDEVAAVDPHGVDLPPWIDGVRALTAWLDGDVPAAVAHLDEAMASIRGQAAATPTSLWGMWVLLHATVDPADDGPRAELRDSDMLVHPNNLAGLRYAEAVSAASAGRVDDAERLFAEGDAAQVPYPYWRHLLHFMLAEHAAEFGYGDPEAWLRSGLAFLADGGEVRLRQRCRQIMRRLGLSVPRQRSTGPGAPRRLRELGITPRQAEVFQLIQEGLSNGQIAARLQLSPRTVETHVAALLAKSGAANRRDLATVLRAP